ncbi:MAG: hypothetical protein OEQ53_13075 [Saprospiraceae bacterium]|nr:hypothetical protein [Saprospiraceae bacterium]
MSQTLKLYIPKVLSENKVVLLKGIGTLRLNYRPAVVDPDLSLLVPPNEEIYFVPSNEDRLDPVLIKIVEIIARVDKHEATTLVLTFMADLKTELRGNGFLTFPNVGWIKQDNWGSLFFEPAAEYISVNRFFGLGQVALPEALSSAEQEVLADLRETAAGSSKQAFVRTHQRKERNWGFVIGMVILLLSLLSLFFLLRNGDRNQGPVEDENNIVQNDRETQKEALQSDTDRAHVNVSPYYDFIKDIGPGFLPQRPLHQEGMPQPRLAECVIIVGAFENSNNVIRMVDRIQSTTYQSVVIEGPRLTKVGLRVSCDVQDKGQALQYAKQEFDPYAWIYNRN